MSEMRKRPRHEGPSRGEGKPDPRAPGITREKARLILKDGTLHGKPLTVKQRGFFGRIAGRAE